MTRKSYPPLAHGPIVECPCCSRMLEIVAYIDGESFYLDDASLHATAVPLREQPCIAHAPSAYHPGAGKVGYVKSCAVGGAVCNWLGPTCNDASHVTPVTPRVAFRPGEAVSAALHLFGADGSKSCTYVNTAHTRDALWLAPGLARCVHLPEA